MQPRGQERALSPWVSLGTDGTVAIISPAVEMGQGSLTSLPRILAEELDADWAQVRIVPAPPIDALYGNPRFSGLMYTAGSASTGYYTNLRLFGAQVRRVLMDNVARKWDVPLAELSTEPSIVVHTKSGAAWLTARSRLSPSPGQGAGNQAGGTEEDRAVPPDRQRHHARRAADQGQRLGANTASTCRCRA